MQPQIPGILLDTAPDAIIVSRSDGTITLANRRAHDMFGYPADALVKSVTRIACRYPPASPTNTRSGWFPDVTVVFPEMSVVQSSVGLPRLVELKLPSTSHVPECTL